MSFLHQKHLVAFSSVAETILICGVLFGWPNLSKIFEAEGYFVNRCQSDAEPDSLNITTAATTSNSSSVEGCALSENALFKTYTTAATLFSVFGLFVGIIYDKWGTMVTRLIGLVLFVLGNVFILMSHTVDHSKDDLLYPGLALLCSSGIFFLTCQMQTANLFTSGAGRVLTMINGSMDTSSGTALLLVTLYESFGFVTCWTIYASLAGFIIIRTLFQLPRTTIPQPLPDNYQIDSPIGGAKRNDDTKLEDESLLDNNNSTAADTNIPDFVSKDVLLSPLYWSTVAFFVLNVFKVYYFIGAMKLSTAETINQVTNATAEESKVLAESMATKFGAVQLLGVFIAPINGYIIDNMMRITKGRKYKSLAVSMMCMIVLGSMFSLISVMPFVNLQYLAYVFSVIHRAFTYGGNAAVIAMCFPIQYFGKLYGISQFATLVSGWLTGKAFDYAFATSFKTLNWILFFLQLVSLWHVVVLVIYAKKDTTQPTGANEATDVDQPETNRSEK